MSALLPVRTLALVSLGIGLAVAAAFFLTGPPEAAPPPVGITPGDRPAASGEAPGEASRGTAGAVSEGANQVAPAATDGRDRRIERTLGLVVVAADTGEPVEHFAVRWRPRAAPVGFDDAPCFGEEIHRGGRVELPLWPGQNDLRVIPADPSLGRSETFAIDPDGLTEDLVVALPRQGVLSVRALDSMGRPIVGIEARWYDTHGRRRADIRTARAAEDSALVGFGWLKIPVLLQTASSGADGRALLHVEPHASGRTLVLMRGGKEVFREDQIDLATLGQEKVVELVAYGGVAIQIDPPLPNGWVGRLALSWKGSAKAKHDRLGGQVSQGRLTLPDVAPGDWHATLNISSPRGVANDPLGPIHVDSGAFTRLRVDGNRFRSATLRGRVTRGGRPVVGSVWLSPNRHDPSMLRQVLGGRAHRAVASHAVALDADGRFEMTGLVATFARLRVETRLDGEDVVAIPIQPEVSIDWGAELEREFELGNGALDAQMLQPDGTPAKQLTVRLERRLGRGFRSVWREAQTDDQGRVQMRLLAEGPWKLHAGRNGASLSTDLDVGTGIGRRRFQLESTKDELRDLMRKNLMDRR